MKYEYTTNEYALMTLQRVEGFVPAIVIARLLRDDKQNIYIYGTSDDLLEFKGAMYREFGSAGTFKIFFKTRFFKTIMQIDFEYFSGVWRAITISGDYSRILPATGRTGMGIYSDIVVVKKHDHLEWIYVNEIIISAREVFERQEK